MTRIVMFSNIVVPTDEWEHGIYQALPIRDAVDSEGVAA